MSGNRRKTDLEQCYTPASAARELTKFVLETVGASRDVEWIEPAAGSGAFVKAAESLGVKTVTAWDIDPKSALVQQADFLSEDVPCTAKVCVTNPPFGRNHSRSIPFFNKLAKSCDLIAFIVPRSWRKWTVVNRLSPHFVKIADWDLALTYADATGSPLTDSTLLNTVFQVWARTDQERVKAPEPKPTQQFTVSKPDKADASITQFGRGTGTVKTNFERRPNTTQLFINAKPEVVSDLGKLNLSPFFNEVAYVEALSRVEIDYALDAFQRGVTIDPDFLKVSNLVEHPVFQIPPHLRTGSFDFTSSKKAAS